MSKSDNDDAWFAPKRFGYGAGLPIAWQGWAVLLAFLGVTLIGGLLMEWDTQIGRPAGIAVIAIAAVGVILVAKAKTRGNWRWRWGEDD